ncbi:hypothetical protein VE03_02901 [Pseudogymnoascus sp. 23342-1-I1]|nr:hypothetical protein VE03_02901 [Pseudogymnoascus sp. 23342-1-I1]
MADFTEKNKAFFDAEAPTFDTKHAKTLSDLITSLRASLPFLAPFPTDPSDPSTPFKLLDYACGTGTITKALSEHCSRVIGIDVSPGMVGVYNTTASNQGLEEEEVRAYVGDLIDSGKERPEEFEGSEFWEFDVAVVGLGFHHFENVGLATSRLAARLRKGGSLVILDFLPHGDSNGHDHSHGGHGHGHGHGHGGHGHGHGHSHGEKEGAGEKKEDAGEKKEDTKVAQTVVHMGFSKEKVQELFEQAGVGLDFGYKVLGKGVVIGPEEKRMKREVFIARGTKA